MRDGDREAASRTVIANPSRSQIGAGTVQPARLTLRAPARSLRKAAGETPLSPPEPLRQDWNQPLSVSRILRHAQTKEGCFKIGTNLAVETRELRFHFGE